MRVISEKKLNYALASLKLRNLSNSIDERKLHCGYYNCWGFTSLLKGWREREEWIDDYKMNWYLEKNCFEVSKKEVKEGDILAMYRYGALQHTVIIYKKGKKNIFLIHKPGAWPLEITSLKYLLNAPEFYMYGKQLKYFRPF